MATRERSYAKEITTYGATIHVTYYIMALWKQEISAQATI